MAIKKDEIASFVMRFTQKIYQVEDGNDHHVQWRGNIRHVQSGDEKRFVAYEDAAGFVKEKLATMTMQAVEDKTPEEQKGILSKSFDLWKKVATTTPKLVLESIKDPKKQVAQIQEQLQEQLNQAGEAIGQKLEIDDWRSSSKNDYKNIVKILEQLAAEVTTLTQKVDALSKK
jgi:uncharacterized protein (DUF885 family)